MLRFAGIGAGGVLACCLVAVVVAMTGGPQAPFTQWAVPAARSAPATGSAGQQGSGHPTGSPGTGNAAPGVGPGTGGGTGTSGTPTAGASVTPAPSGTSPSPTAGPSVTASPSGSATPTNRAGKTPPGQTKSPNPHQYATAL